MKPFAGTGKKGSIDGLSSLCRFDSPRGIAINSQSCLVGDLNCIRSISCKGIFFFFFLSFCFFPSLFYYYYSLFIVIYCVGLNPRVPVSPLSSSSSSLLPSSPDRPPLYHTTSYFTPSSSKSLASTQSSPSSPELLKHLSSSTEESPRRCTLSTPSTPSSSSSSSTLQPSPSSLLATRSLIPFKDLSKLEKIGEGLQGIVYKAEWNGQVIVYKQMKLLDTKVGEEKAHFERQFNVWQYDSSLSHIYLFFSLLFYFSY